jgi:hypothetical protein
VVVMRSIKTAIVKIGTLVVSLLVGTVLVLSTSPVSASGEDKVMNDKGKVEINKVEKDKDKKEMIEVKKLKDKLGELRIHRIDLLLDEDILEEIHEDIEEED